MPPPLEHRKPIKKPNIIGANRREAAERFAAYVKKDHRRQRDSHRHFIAQALHIRDTVASTDQIIKIIDEIEEQAKFPSSFEVPQGSLLQPAIFPNHHTRTEIQLLSCAVEYNISTQLQLILKQLLDELLCVTPFVSEVDRIFNLISSRANVFLQLLEVLKSQNFSNPLVEKTFFLLTCIIALLSSQKPDETIQLGFVKHLGQLIHPNRGISLRCLQVATWSLSVFDQSFHPSAHPPFLSLDEYEQILSKTLAISHFTCALLQSVSKEQLLYINPKDQCFHPDPFSVSLGTVSPFGGCLGYLRVASQFLASASKYRAIRDALLGNNHFISLVMNIVDISKKYGIEKALASSSNDAETSSAFSPNCYLRLTLEDTLLALDQCLDGLCSDQSHPSNVLLSVDLVDIIWNLCYSALQLKPNQSPIDTSFLDQLFEDQYINAFQSFLLNGSEVGLDRLCERPSDLLVPGIHILGCLCYYNKQNKQSYDMLHRLVQLEHIMSDSHSNVLMPTLPVVQIDQSRFLVKALLSRHYGIKQCALDLIALFAVSKEPYDKVALQLAPLIGRILEEPEPFFVKRAAMLVVLHLSFHREAVYLSHVLQLDIPSPVVFNSLALPIDEPLSQETHPPCDICGRRSIIDSILALLSPSQHDIPLINMCLDYLEELLSHSPELKALLYKHDVIEKVESVQCIDNDDLFHRSIYFVKKYYDDFDETQL